MNPQVLAMLQAMMAQRPAGGLGDVSPMAGLGGGVGGGMGGMGMGIGGGMRNGMGGGMMRPGMGMMGGIGQPPMNPLGLMFGPGQAVSMMNDRNAENVLGPPTRWNPQWSWAFDNSPGGSGGN